MSFVTIINSKQQHTSRVLLVFLLILSIILLPLIECSSSTTGKVTETLCSGTRTNTVHDKVAFQQQQQNGPTSSTSSNNCIHQLSSLVVPFELALLSCPSTTTTTRTRTNLFSSLSYNDEYDYDNDFQKQQQEQQYQQYSQKKSLEQLSTKLPSNPFKRRSILFQSEISSSNSNVNLHQMFGNVVKDFIVALVIFPWKVMQQMIIVTQQLQLQQAYTIAVQVQQQKEESETIQKLVILFRNIIENSNSDSNSNSNSDSQTIMSFPVSTSTGRTNTTTSGTSINSDYTVVQPKVPRMNNNNNNNNNSNNNNSTNNSNNDDTTSNDSTKSNNVVKENPRKQQHIFTQYDEDNDNVIDYYNDSTDTDTDTDDDVIRDMSSSSNSGITNNDLDYKLLLSSTQKQQYNKQVRNNNIDSSTTTNKLSKQDIAKQAIELVQVQARKNVLRKKQLKLTKAFNNHQQQNNNEDDSTDTTYDTTQTGQWFVQEQIAEQKERKRLVQHAKKQFLLQEKEKRKKLKQIPTKVATKPTVTARKVTTITKKNRQLLSEEENRIAENARIRSQSIGNGSTMNKNNNDMDDDDDPDTQLELLAIAARQAVEAYELKNQRNTVADVGVIMKQEQEQQPTEPKTQQGKEIFVDSSIINNDKKDESNINMQKKQNKNRKNSNNNDSLLSFYSEPTNINFDIAQAARNAVQAFEVSSKQLLFGTTSTNNNKEKKLMKDSGKQSAAIVGTTTSTKSIDDWSKFTVVQLKTELRKRSLPITGKKEKLIQTIVDYEYEQQQKQQQQKQKEQQKLVDDTATELQQQVQESSYHDDDNTNEVDNLENDDDDDVTFSWQNDLGVSDTLMINLEKLAQNAQDNIDSYYKGKDVITEIVSSSSITTIPKSSISSSSTSTGTIDKKISSNSKSTTVVVPDYETMTVAVLKSELRNRKLLLSGRKAELIARLVANDADQVQVVQQVHNDVQTSYETPGNTNNIRNNIKQEETQSVHAYQPLSLLQQVVPNSNNNKNGQFVQNGNNDKNLASIFQRTDSSINKRNNIPTINTNFDTEEEDVDDDDDDDSFSFDDVTEEDIQALSLIDQLLAGIDKTIGDDDDEPTDEALWAIENELNAVAASASASASASSIKSSSSSLLLSPPPSFFNGIDSRRTTINNNSNSNNKNSNGVQSSVNGIIAAANDIDDDDDGMVLFSDTTSRQINQQPNIVTTTTAVAATKSSTITTSTSIIDYNKLSVTQLKEELQQRNLRITGKKNDLIDRLHASDELNRSLLV